MKTKLLFTVFLLSAVSVCDSQITQDYPFKTYLDNDNNLYVVGYKHIGSTKDILIVKYPPGGQTFLWEETYANTHGDDRGLDLAIDNNGKVVVAGYIFNQQTNTNDVITMQLSSETGDTIWTRKIIITI